MLVCVEKPFDLHERCRTIRIPRIRRRNLDTGLGNLARHILSNSIYGFSSPVLYLLTQPLTGRSKPMVHEAQSFFVTLKSLTFIKMPGSLQW